MSALPIIHVMSELEIYSDLTRHNFNHSIVKASAVVFTCLHNRILVNNVSNDDPYLDTKSKSFIFSAFYTACISRIKETDILIYAADKELFHIRKRQKTRLSIWESAL